MSSFQIIAIFSWRFVSVLFLWNPANQSWYWTQFLQIDHLIVHPLVLSSSRLPYLCASVRSTFMQLFKCSTDCLIGHQACSTLELCPMYVNDYDENCILFLNYFCFEQLDIFFSIWVGKSVNFLNEFFMTAGGFSMAISNFIDRKNLNYSWKDRTK